MATTLTQTADASFPDRPRDGAGVGMKVALSQGNDGAHLLHDLAGPHSSVYVRFALRDESASGGAAWIAGGCDAQGQPVWWVDYDADTGHVTCHHVSGPTVSVTLNALSWHVIEIGVDATAGALRVWIDGVLADEAAGGVSSPATRHVWLGAIFKATSLAGHLHFDEWAVSDTAPGVVTVAPESDYANDPARWLVIYNTAVNDAVAWVESYRSARGLPYANLLGLDLPITETIDDAQYASLVASINTYLSRHDLDDQVMGILAGYGVPGYVDYFGDGTLEPLPALLHRLDGAVDTKANANAANALPSRVTRAQLGPDRLTARIDGPDLASAQAITSRATALMSDGLADAEQATLWFDPFAGDGSVATAYIDRMLEWVQSIDRMRTRLPLKLSGDIDQPDVDAEFSAIHDDGFLWSWDRTTPSKPPADFFASPAGKRVFCLQMHLTAPSATSMRSATPSNWIEAPLANGYASAAAASRSYSPSAIPYARPFFEAMRRGWTLAEAWYLAAPLLREGLYLTGDPLMRVALPKRGWDVFGPVSRLTAFTPDQPLLALREHETSWPLSDDQKPGPGHVGTYVVRHVDARGRSEGSLSIVSVVNHAGQAGRPPTRPIWPDHAHWPVRMVDQALVFELLWDRPLGVCAVESVALRGEVDGGAEMTLSAPALDPRRERVRVTLAMPAQSGRYRWRITSSAGVVVETPWSQRVQPSDMSNHSLTVLEIEP